MKRSVGLLLVFGLAAGACPAPSAAHAFPDHSQPRVGSALESSPGAVRIWFDGDLEPVFSRIRVMNENHEPVDKADGRVEEKDRTLLEVSLPTLSPGTYHVLWVAVSVDGHRTEGDFSFTVMGPP